MIISAKGKLFLFLFLFLQTIPTLAQTPLKNTEENDYIARRRAALAREAKADEPHWYLKSNALGWAMLVGNIAVEFDLGHHLSFNFPVYYSATDYFSSKLKLRTFTLQPELRYWIPEAKGLFVGAHAGVAWFNYALGGDWRYQDHNRNTPMLGGGLNVGYRRAISKNNRWFIEFSIGGGVYALHYDKFRNEPNGEWVASKKSTFYGVDHAAITFAYQLNLKGGNR